MVFNEIYKKISVRIKDELTQLKNFSPNRKIRDKALCIMLSESKYCIQQISEILNYTRQTICRWIDNFSENGLPSLEDKPRSGRPRKLTPKDEFLVANLIADNPRSLKSVIATLSEETGVSISLKTIKRLAKELGLSWKRIRKTTKTKRDEKSFKKAKKEIEALLDQAKEKKIDVFFYDESGVNMTPNVPYAWQLKGIKTDIEIPSFKGKTLNIAGFLGHDHSFTSYVFEESINSSAVIGCIDDFLKKIDKKTYLILDNAPAHKSYDFSEKIKEWEKKGLIIKFLPTYSPELNKIEILWRFLKYKWLPFDSYESFDKLKENLFDILKNIGKKYRINFSFLT